LGVVAGVDFGALWAFLRGVLEKWDVTCGDFVVKRGGMRGEHGQIYDAILVMKNRTGILGLFLGWRASG
jgi:hypothetical protein